MRPNRHIEQLYSLPRSIQLSRSNSMDIIDIRDVVESQ